MKKVENDEGEDSLRLGHLKQIEETTKKIMEKGTIFKDKKTEVNK